MRLIVLFTLITAVPSTWAGQYNICTDSAGHKSFQEKPCPSNSKAETRTYESAEAPATTLTPSPTLTTANPTYQRLQANNRRMELNRDLRKSEQWLTQLERDRNHELGALKAKQRPADNIDSSAWEHAISAEVQAASERFSGMIDTERARHAQLQEELDKLRAD